MRWPQGTIQMERWHGTRQWTGRKTWHIMIRCVMLPGQTGAFRRYCRWTAQATITTGLTMVQPIGVATSAPPGALIPAARLARWPTCYYTNLGNLAVRDLSGNIQPGSGLNNTGPFLNLQDLDYWSGAEYAPITLDAWYFYFGLGTQDFTYESHSTHAWAVMDGDVGAPPCLFLEHYFLLAQVSSVLQG